MSLYDTVRDFFLGLSFALLLPLTLHYGLELLSPQASAELIFYASVAIGILFIIIGTLLKLGFIGGGLILGGVFCIWYGYIHVWFKISTAIRFGSLLGALLVILGLAYFLTKRK